MKPWLLVALAGVAALLGGAVIGLRGRVPPVPELHFRLVDHHNAPRRAEDYRGRWLLVYFGFTRCPSVCPTELGFLKRIVNGLGPAGEAVQPLFITLDPQRDPPAVLAGYAPLFHPRLIGLTGTPEQTAAAAASMGVRWAKQVFGADPSNYVIDHTYDLLLVDPDGRLRARFDSTRMSEAAALALVRGFVAPP
jgi:protein SCO1/2